MLNLSFDFDSMSIYEKLFDGRDTKERKNVFLSSKICLWFGYCNAYEQTMPLYIHHVEDVGHSVVF